MNNDNKKAQIPEFVDTWSFSSSIIWNFSWDKISRTSLHTTFLCSANIFINGRNEEFKFVLPEFLQSLSMQALSKKKTVELELKKTTRMTK